jgi:hypothetical protein
VERVVDLVVPIGAVLVICFSIGSIFYGSGPHLTASAPPHIVKAYRKDVSPAQP